MVKKWLNQSFFGLPTLIKLGFGFDRVGEKYKIKTTVFNQTKVSPNFPVSWKKTLNNLLLKSTEKATLHFKAWTNDTI